MGEKKWKEESRPEWGCFFSNCGANYVVGRVNQMSGGFAVTASGECLGVRNPGLQGSGVRTRPTISFCSLQAGWEAHYGPCDPSGNPPRPLRFAEAFSYAFHRYSYRSANPIMLNSTFYHSTPKAILIKSDTNSWRFFSSMLSDTVILPTKRQF